MYCPVCKGEFREGFTECSGCQVNLVADLDHITEKITGEFLLCQQCEREFHEELTNCPGCGLRLIRAVLQDDTYVFLEEQVMEYAAEPETTGLDHLEYFVDINDEDSVVILESEDMELMGKLQKILNTAGINFSFRHAEDDAGSLGSIFGAGSPLARSFPKVVVRKEDEERALQLVANHPELGLFDIPAELCESEDAANDDTDDDYSDDNDDADDKNY